MRTLALLDLSEQISGLRLRLVVGPHDHLGQDSKQDALDAAQRGHAAALKAGTAPSDSRWDFAELKVRATCPPRCQAVI